jgi:sulfate adenylyltransferase
MERQTIAPHGGRLVNRLVEAEQRRSLLRELPRLKRLRLNSRQASDLELIAVGAFSPLEGFLGEADYRSVLREMRLANGLPWTIPITLAVGGTPAARLGVGDEVALEEEPGRVLGVLHLSEKYRVDPREEAQLVYRTTEEAHPGVAELYRQGEVLLAGRVSLLEPPRPGPFGQYRLGPAETRRAFRERGWRRVVGFQTRNPTHRAHEYLQKCALETVDGLLLHPLVGETKSDDLPPEVRMACYRMLLERYYPRDRVLLAVLPAAMRYAGPREAVFHALVRKNYGCTHFIVGRDHAGVGRYYGSYDAHYIFDEFDPEELGIIPMFFDHAFYCRACGGMATSKTCPHEEGQRLSLSGTVVRQMLERGEAPPPEVVRPEIAVLLVEASWRASDSMWPQREPAAKERGGAGCACPAQAQRKEASE